MILQLEYNSLPGIFGYCSNHKTQAFTDLNNLATQIHFVFASKALDNFPAKPGARGVGGRCASSAAVRVIHNGWSWRGGLSTDQDGQQESSAGGGGGVGGGGRPRGQEDGHGSETQVRGGRVGRA